MGDGDRLTRCDLGHLHWGRFGAAGLLVHHGGHVLLQRRAWWTMGGGRWGIFGGARASGEDALAAALRETAEESTLDVAAVTPHGVLVEDHGGWAYQTVVATAPALLDVAPASAESIGAGWFVLDEVAGLDLFQPFAAAWPRVRECLLRVALVIDAANVVGSRPDGWWRDRAGAAARLRDQVAAVASFAGMTPFDLAYPEVTLVVEGAARGIGPGGTDLRVLDAPGSGDDTIVGVVATLDPDVRAFVITADRELARRCAGHGATVAGPNWLLSRLG